MSDSNRWRAERTARGVCVGCGKIKPVRGRVRCVECAKRNAKPPAPSAVILERDLAELRAIRAGKPPQASGDAAGPLPVIKPDIRFIRAQEDRAVPLLAKLYLISEAKVRLIRGLSPYSERSQRMPLRLLKELVEQRTGTYHIDNFTTRESSITECTKA